MPEPRKITRRIPPRPPAPPVPAVAADRLLGDILALIEAAREQTARVVCSVQVVPYWNIGKRIREDVLQEKRAAYGQAIVSTLSKQLPPRKLLEKTLHESIRRARERLATAEQDSATEARTSATGPALPRRIPKKGPKG